MPARNPVFSAIVPRILLLLLCGSLLPALAAPAPPASTNALPAAYLFPARFTAAITNLQRHGIEVRELRETVRLDLELLVPTALGSTNTTNLLVTKTNCTLSPGMIVVRTDQKRGSLASTLLEPSTADGLAAWHLFGSDWRSSGHYPVLRLRSAAPLLTALVRPLPEDRTFHRQVSFDTLYGKNPVNFGGSAARFSEWLPSGKAYVQSLSGRLWRVDALTGRRTPLLNSNKVFRALRRIPGMTEGTARSWADARHLDFNPAVTGALMQHESDLFYFALDGSRAARLTHTPGVEEFPSFSPDGKWVAFIRSNNLHVVDITGKRERAITTDGGGDIRNGLADWVYFEEIQNREWRAFWWSPDSKSIAFERFDSSALPWFHAVNTIPLHGNVERFRHPKAGDPNPAIKLGVAAVSGGPVRWADLQEYGPDFLISHVGWTPDSKSVYCYVQNRIQTWLDFNLWRVGSPRPEKLFRDSNPAWIESPGPARFLRSGDILFISDRSGYRHLYRFHRAGRTWTPITAGEWEVRGMEHVNERQGWIYFTATATPLYAEHLYRCRLNPSTPVDATRNPTQPDLEHLTPSAGHHRISADPKMRFVIDTWSSIAQPEQVVLRDSSGATLRILDANPSYTAEEFDWGSSERLQIPATNGFQIEAAIVKPVGFDPARRYPVWLMTYAGPGMPSLRNSWTSRAYDQMLANLGLIVFRMDPRSASGKGSRWAWSAYRQLGVSELADITTSVEWLKSQPWVDGSRIGMSGHSFGGFITAYALTHSDLFAAGIAGAPVTDWRFYDSIYTERYMDVPTNNVEGYKIASVAEAAPRLHGKLLLLHGMMDDNVHLQNATALIKALQDADKDFEIMMYPEMRHGLYGAHYQRLHYNFIRRSLRLDK